MSILGNRVLRREDPKFLTTGGVYGEDLPFDGALWVTFVRSTLAHARITSIDTEEAKRIPGVVGIYSGRDVDLLSCRLGCPESRRRWVGRQGTGLASHQGRQVQLTQ